MTVDLSPKEVLALLHSRLAKRAQELVDGELPTSLHVKNADPSTVASLLQATLIITDTVFSIVSDHDIE